MKNFINNTPLIHKFNRLKPQKKVLQDIRNTLLSGGVVMYPTDTCYALSCIVTDSDAVEKIYRIKQRPIDKHVSIACSDSVMLEKYAHIDSEVRSFLHRFAPERFTLLLPKRKAIWEKIDLLKDTDTVGVRIPKDLFTRKLIQSVGIPLVTTSANLSGHQELYTEHDVRNFLSAIDEMPEIIIVGHLQKNPPSTIIDTMVQPWTVIRQGKFRYFNNN